MWNEVFAEEEMKEVEEKAETEEFEEELPGDLIHYLSRLNEKVLMNYQFIKYLYQNRSTNIFIENFRWYLCWI